MHQRHTCAHPTHAPTLLWTYRGGPLPRQKVLGNQAALLHTTLSSQVLGHKANLFRGREDPSYKRAGRSICSQIESKQ